MFKKIKNFLKNTLFYILYKKFKALFFKFFYWSPDKDLFVIWITGTDWKTTTANLIHFVLNDMVWPTLLLSTTQVKIGDKIIENDKKMTSFDPKDMYKYLFLAKRQGIKYAVLEVSSHWLEQYRFYWIDFDLWVLTNISPEHLDYHKTFEDYINAKKKLFKNVLLSRKSSKMAVLPKDDEIGRKWMEEMVFDKMIDYWIMTSATLKWENIKESIDGLEFDIKYLGKYYSWKSKLKWRFNMYNILAAIWVGLLLKLKIDDILGVIEKFEGVPWRQEIVKKDWKIWIIDFAHTPKALQSVLKYLNNIKWGWKIYTIFGAPGERDKYKRPEMAEVVSKFSDFFVITDDDPANEDRYKIIYDIWEGVDESEGKKFFVIPNRKKAIEFINGISKSWDIILLAGKGHEKIQLTNFWKIDYSDKDVVMSL